MRLGVWIEIESVIGLACLGACDWNGAAKRRAPFFYAAIAKTLVACVLDSLANAPYEPSSLLCAPECGKS